MGQTDMRTEIRTWADGFGVWHAEIIERGIGHDAIAHALALAAIHAELRVREWGFDPASTTIRLVSRVSRGKALVSEYVESGNRGGDAVSNDAVPYVQRGTVGS